MRRTRRRVCRWHGPGASRRWALAGSRHIIGIAFVCILSLLGCARSSAAGRGSEHRESTQAASEARAVPFRVIDATGPFWAFWEVHAKSEPVVRRDAFIEAVIRGNPALFGPGVVRGRLTGSRLDEYLASLETRVEAMRALNRRLESTLQRDTATFMARFPEMRWAGDVYITFSIDSFDGAVRDIDGKATLLFGLDRIQSLHGDDANLSALFHHELFHVHHHHVNPSTPEERRGLLSPLWREGLAVYVTRVMHPEATNAQLILTDEMVSEGERRLPELARELRALLDEATPEEHREYFQTRRQRGQVPERVGYFVGMRVAEELARTHSLETLLRLREPALRHAVRDALGRLAASPSGASGRVTSGGTTVTQGR